MFSKKFSYFRKKSGLSQAETAEYIGVTRQAVQKWEHGSALPDAGKLILVAKLFGTTIDALLGDEKHEGDDIRHSAPALPKYDAIHIWEAYYTQLPLELRQSAQEGRDVRRLKGLVREIDRLPSDECKKELGDIAYRMIEASPKQPSYKYIEPSEYDRILPLCHPVPNDYSVSHDLLRNKLIGAWMGRVCGCMLGKPVEGMKLRELIPFLKETENYPMQRYINSTDITEEIKKKYDFSFWIDCFGDTMNGAHSDDDTNYTILASKLLDKCGRGFKPSDVALLWVESQVKDAYCTAERVAYLNIVNGYVPPDTAVYHNPYREWIGAQIRADYFGYINPGDPIAAAEMAFRDASISHVKNGIYGEMFVAAMIAAAACLDDPSEVIRAGLGCIPYTSRLYEYISGILGIFERGGSFEDCIMQIRADFDDEDNHDWCHTISNAAIVSSALLYGGRDYSKTICLAVQSGFDTDCNGATAGSILGMMLGIDSIDEKWTAPVQGTIDSTIFGMAKTPITFIADKALSHMAQCE